MKPIQQRRPFPAAAKSEVKAMIESQRTLQESRFQPWGWIVAVSAALLLISCASSPKPDKTCALAGQSAEAGARAWLKEHPDHREAFRLAVNAARAETNELKSVQYLHSLPTSALAGSNGVVYISEPHILVYDGRRAVIASQGARKATLAGIKRGMVPMPPMPQRVRRGNPLVAASEGAVGHASGSGQPQPSESDARLDADFAEYLLAKTNRVGLYRVERLDDGTNWTQIAGFTSPVGQFRVRRVK